MRLMLSLLFLLTVLPVAYGQDMSPEQSSTDDEQAALDKFRAGLTRTVNSTARWIDSFFTDKMDPAAYNTASGSLRLTPEWSEYDGLRVDSSFRAKVIFPQAERKFSAMIGRGDFDDFITETHHSRPSVIHRGHADEEWMIGLGFDPHIENKQHRVSFGAGFRGGLKLDPYLQARYRYDIIISPRAELSTQSIAFWRDSDGFGVSQTMELEAALSDRWLSKSWVKGTFAERSDGLRWQASQKFYYMYHVDRALGAEFWWYGETSHEVPMQDYGLRGLHRQRFLREWLFLESWVGLHWPREKLTEQREPRWLVGIELELLFGS